jgi:multiple antibiotic resistance protein
MIAVMNSRNLADTFVTLLAIVGPQKVLIDFARIARTHDVRTVRIVAVASGGAAAAVGLVCALTAPWIASFFHITTPDLELAAGIVFFVYAIGLVLGIHFGRGNGHADADGDPEDDALHPLYSGFRAMLLPFVVSPLAVAAVLQASISSPSWGSRWTVAGAFVLVVLVDVGCTWVFARLLRRMHDTVLEVLSRLLGTLLAAVGMQLFLQGLVDLGVLHSAFGH